MEISIVAFIDGSCEPVNPGGAMGIGVVISKDGEIIKEHSEKFDAAKNNTNNIAEYMALEFLLSYLILLGTTNTGIEINSDSMLVINQMSKKWKIKKGFYRPYALRCDHLVDDLIANGNKFKFQWVSRDKNQHADDLSKAEQPVVKDYKKPYLKAV